MHRFSVTGNATVRDESELLSTPDFPVIDNVQASAFSRHRANHSRLFGAYSLAFVWRLLVTRSLVRSGLCVRDKFSSSQVVKCFPQTLSKMAPLRWGFVGCGEISHDFASCLESLPREEHQLIAASASDAARAKKFAEEFGFQKSYGSYAELARDPDVQVVYIGTINTNHFENVKMMLEADKHVLCEKPLTLMLEHTRHLVQLAENRKKFFMEAVWSRCFPAYKQVRDILKAGTIGDVKLVSAHFGIIAEDNPSSDRLYRKKKGGGSLVDIGGYCLQIIQLVYGPEMPEKVKANAIMTKEGIDKSVTCSLQWKDGRMATFATSFMSHLQSDAFIFGSKGHIRIPRPFWCPEKVILKEIKKPDEDEKETKFDFPLPETKKEMKYGNGQGMTYEAQEVYRCISAGLLESPLITHKETLNLGEMYNAIFQEIGLSYADLYQGGGASTTHPQ